MNATQNNVVDFTPAIGHNSQRNFVKEMMAAYDAIFQAKADPQVTLIRLAIWRHTNWNDCTSRASQETLKRDCSGFASESTFKRHFPEAKKAFGLAPGGGRGRANVYTIKMDQTAAELSVLMKNRGQPDTPLNRGQSEPSLAKGGQPDTPLSGNRGQINRGQIDLETRVNLTPPSDIESDRKKKKEGSASGDARAAVLPLLPSAPPVDKKIEQRRGLAQLALDLYNEVARRCGLALAKVLTPHRERAIVLRIKEAGGIDAYKAVLLNIEKSAFLRGQNDRGWRADFDWLAQPKSFHRLREGGYSGCAQASQAGSSYSKSGVYTGALL